MATIRARTPTTIPTISGVPSLFSADSGDVPAGLSDDELVDDEVR